MDIKLAKGETSINKCFAVMKELRPHLEETKFIPMVKEMIEEGYKLAFIEVDGVAIAAIGYRYLQFLFNGKHIYIDDLSTLPTHRGNGYANLLLDFVFNESKKASIL